MTKWTRIFDYADGLDFEQPNPAPETVGSQAGWDETRRALEIERIWHGGHEREIAQRTYVERLTKLTPYGRQT